MTATDRKNFRKHIRRLRTVATTCKDEDRRTDAVRSLAAIYLAQNN